MTLEKRKNKPEIPIVKRTLSSWIFDGNISLQISLVVIIMVMIVIRVIPLEMQKRIVNEAINLRKLDLLMIYSGIYLGSVVFASLLKLMVNIIQTKISQDITARMRKQLYCHVLTMPLTFFRGTQPGTIVNSLINELTVPGNFVGMAIAVPLTNVFTLLAFAVYLIMLNPLLGVVSFSIYPALLYIIPVLQKKVNRDNKKRINTSRKLSSNIVEAVSGIHEIQANGAFAIENNKFDTIVDYLTKIRIKWSIYKFIIKVVNNFFINMGPFCIFIIGGYLSIKGQLDLGALIAFLSAQEKLHDPWKELIEFYQVYQDGSINYYKAMSYFDVKIEHKLLPKGREPLDLDVAIDVENMGMETKEGIKLLNNINLHIAPGEQIALVGFSGSGKSTLALCLAQLYKYTSGRAKIGNREISDLTKADMTKNIGLVSQSPFIFDGTVKENLLYSYKALYGEDCVFNGECKPELDSLVHVLQQSGLFVDVLRFGLDTIIEKTSEELIQIAVQMRAKFKKEYGNSVEEMVEFFDENQFLSYASIADNIIFGDPVAKGFKRHNLVKNSFFLKFMDDADLTRPLLALGKEIADQTVDILKNISHDKVFFEQSIIRLEEFEKYENIVHQIKGKNLHEISRKYKNDLLELALRFSPGKHGIASISGFLANLILEGRYMFRQRILQEDPDAIAFFRNDQYIHSKTIYNNILFGIVKTSNPGDMEQINQFMVALLIEEDVLEKMIEIGMEFKVGTMGNKLSGGQRQKLAIARIFFKSPPVMIMDEATSALDNNSQQRIQTVLARQWKGKSTLIAVAHRLDIVKEYDKVAFLKAGTIVEIGSYEELMAKKGYFYGLATEHK